MEQPQFDKNKLIEHWMDASDEDFNAMVDIYETKRYSWALFIGHLSVEKLLKALYIQVNNEFPPLIHDLLRLAERCKLALTEEQEKDLDTITRFNIRARYDNYIKAFQLMCTPEYTSEWMGKIKLTRIWIKKLMI